MRLQSKFMLALLPPVLAALLVLGVWSAFKATEVVHQNAEHYLQTALDTFMTQDLLRRYQILQNNHMDQVPSFVRAYQKEAAEAAAKIKLVLTGHIFVFDQAGKLVFDTREQEAAVMESRWAPAIKRLLAAKTSGIQGHVVGEFYKAIRFRPWNWLVFISFDDRSVHHAAWRIQIATLIFTLGIAALMILVLGLLFRRLVAKPVSTLRKAARQIASQDFPESVPVASGDELGSLARDMERMSADIRTNQQKILRFSNQLESMVDERTEKLRKSQARLARAQEIAQIGNWEWEINAAELHWSDQVFSIFGLTPGAIRPTYEALVEFIHPEDRQMVREVVGKAIDEQRTFSVEHRIVRPDGEVRVVSAIGETTAGPDGRPLKVTGTVHDITERIDAEQERMDRQKLQGAIETAGAVCHELTQPMQAIMLHVELLKNQDVDPALTDRILAILREVEKMAKITAKLQRLTRYETRDYLEESRILDLDKSSN